MNDGDNKKNALASLLNSAVGSTLANGAFGLAGTGLSMLYNYEQSKQLTGAQREQNAFNALEAQKQRDYETEMSNTAFQRQVADMRAVGLNPALMYGGTGASGASTPSGSSASGSGNGGQQFDPMQLLSIMMQNGVSLSQLNEQKRVNDSEIALNQAKEESERAKARKDSASAIYQEWLNSPEMRNIEKETRSGSLEQIRAKTANLLANTDAQRANVELINSQTKLNITDEQYKRLLMINQRIQNEVADKCKEYKINQESYKATQMYWDSIVSSVKGGQYQNFGLDIGSLSSNPIVAVIQIAGMGGWFIGNQMDNAIGHLADALQANGVQEKKSVLMEKLEELWHSIFDSSAEKSESDKAIDENYWDALANQAFK